MNGPKIIFRTGRQIAKMGGGGRKVFNAVESRSIGLVKIPNPFGRPTKRRSTSKVRPGKMSRSQSLAKARRAKARKRSKK